MVFRVVVACAMQREFLVALRGVVMGRVTMC